MHLADFFLLLDQGFEIGVLDGKHSAEPALHGGVKPVFHLLIGEKQRRVGVFQHHLIEMIGKDIAAGFHQCLHRLA